MARFEYWKKRINTGFKTRFRTAYPRWRRHIGLAVVKNVELTGNPAKNYEKTRLLGYDKKYPFYLVETVFSKLILRQNAIDSILLACVL